MSHAGWFLVARTMLKDPNFDRTVVLLLAHGPDGAFGLVLNRPLEVEEAPWPVFQGGPCASPGVVMLHGQPGWVEESEDEGPGKEIVPGVWVGDARCLERAAEEEDESARFRVFTGYAGWGSGQLEGELARGAWALVQANAELVFDTPPEELWDRVSPPRIPQPSLN
jgi:putative transcriptional regulator